MNQEITDAPAIDVPGKIQTAKRFERAVCAHCGDKCPPGSPTLNEMVFCCNGCLQVYSLLQENELCNYYELNKLAGNSLKGRSGPEKFRHLDNESVFKPLCNFYSPEAASSTLYLPGIHCSSCLWLLENLPRLRPGILQSRVSFTTKLLTVQFNPSVVSFRELAELLTTIGYEPQLTLPENGTDGTPAISRKLTRDLITRIGVTGFCFGNIMLLSLPEYFNSNIRHEEFGNLFMYLNLALALPVVFYGAWPWFRSAFNALLNNHVNIDVPICIGIAALFTRSLFESLSGAGPGWFDSMAGLVFFLLIGRYVQGLAFEGMNFRRSWRSFFPLAVTKITDGLPESVLASEVKTGDVLSVHNREPLPCDCILLSPHAQLDYSFITGEAIPTAKKAGEELPAGGIICGQSAVVRVLHPINESSLANLWNNREAITNQDNDKESGSRLSELFARYFTLVTIAIALAAGGFWLWQNNPAKALNAFTAVLIIACPCAFSLSLPFTMGNALVILGRNRIFVRNEGVIQRLATVTHVALDKTGTLTEANKMSFNYIGATALPTRTLNLVKTAARSSSHPLCKNLYNFLNEYADMAEPDFVSEYPGQGTEVHTEGTVLLLGNAEFAGAQPGHKFSGLHINLNGSYLGGFSVSQTLRHGVAEALHRLREHYKLSVLTGDVPEGLSVLSNMAACGTVSDAKKVGSITLRALQQPAMKADYIKKARSEGQIVLMAGDGLNDGPALKAANIGMAMQNNMHAFTPASDIIADAASVALLPKVLQFADGCINIVKISFLLSLVYNAIGLSLAVNGTLSPVFAAVFMPLSSMSVVGLAVGLSSLYAKHLKF